VTHQKFVVPEFRLNEIRSFVERGLEDFSISRLKSKMPWGIAVPGDDTQVMYVWFDALVNYISTLGWPENTEQFQSFWVNGSPTQYCGKDNLRQQSAMWQAMLMAAGLPNSHQIIINGFFNGEGGIKMSKSIGNVVNPADVVAEYGTDALRYYVTREVSMFEDSPFYMEKFKEVYNANLANGLGNLLSRSMNMVASYGVNLSGIIFPDYAEVADTSMERFELNVVMDNIWAEISKLDRYVQETEPFKTVKTNPEKAHADIQKVIQGLANIAVQLQPFLPASAQTIIDTIKAGKKPEQPLFLRKE
jgi:methionyl-tRNA synthetase